MTDTTEQQQKYQQLIAKCWSDEAYKKRLLAEPNKTLREEGWNIPEGITVVMCEDTDQGRHIVIPAIPSELTDEQLANVDGGILPLLMIPASTLLVGSAAAAGVTKALQKPHRPMTKAEFDKLNAIFESLGH